MIQLLLPAAFAQDPALASGEFRNTADTTPKGEFVIHPLLRSSYGLTDKLDFKLSPLGFLAGGPQLFVEYQLVGGDGPHLSIEPSASASWNFRSFSAGGMVRSTFPVGPHRFNLSAGGTYGQTYVRDADLNTDGDQPQTTVGASVPLNVGFDLVPSDATTVRFVLNTEVLAMTSGVFAGSLGINWNHAFGDRFRLSLGGVLLYGVVPGFYQALADAGLPAVPPILPFPTFELWWRL